MKLSDLKNFNDLTIEDYTNIVYGDYTPNLDSADAIVLLGGNELWCLDRADACSKIAKEYNIKYIIPSGGVKVKEGYTEAEFLKELLVEKGIDAKRIILENQATTTRENVVYANEILETLPDVKKVVIVTSHFHLRRGMAIAKTCLDKKYIVEGYPGQVLEGNKENWYKSEYYTKRVHDEVGFLKSYTSKGLIEEIEF